MDDQTSEVPIDVLSWLLALSPIVALLVLLAVLRWKAPHAGPVGMFIGIAIALVAFRTPWDTLAVAGAKGVWDAVFILFVVWPALLLYRVIDRAGGFAALRSGITRFTENQLFLVLAFGWVFASFLQGIAEPEPVMSLRSALVPYLVLTVVATATIAVGPVRDALEQVQVSVPFPATASDHDVEREAEASYSPFSPLTHPGTFLLFSAAVAWVLYRRHDAYQRWEAESPEGVEPILPAMTADAVPASAAIVGFLVLSQVMDHSGQTEVLALGVSEVAPAGVYAFFAGWIGMLGSFMTSSNASSNIIFSPLQQTLAGVQDLAEPTVLSAQHAGGAVGNSISPSNVVLGTGAAGIVGQEGEVLRKVLPYAVASALLIGAGTLALGPWA